MIYGDYRQPRQKDENATCEQHPRGQRALVMGSESLTSRGFWLPEVFSKSNTLQSEIIEF